MKGRSGPNRGDGTDRPTSGREGHQEDADKLNFMLTVDGPSLRRRLDIIVGFASESELQPSYSYGKDLVPCVAAILAYPRPIYPSCGE